MADDIDILDWTGGAFARPSQVWRLDARTISGGVSLAGREQVIVSGLPVWRATLTFRVGKGDERRWLAMVARLRGRGRAVRLYPDCCEQTPLMTRLGVAGDRTDIPHSDDALFSDDTGYAQGAPEFAAATAAAIYTDRLTLTLGGYEAGLIPGDWLGVAGNLYLVTALVATTATTMTVEVEPPLRAAVAAGDAVTTRPTVVLRLTEDMQGETRRDGRPQTPSLDFIELPELT